MSLFYDSVTETLETLQKDPMLSGYVFQTAYPPAYKASPLKNVTITANFGGAQIMNAGMGDFLGVKASGDHYGKTAEITVRLTVWTPLSLGGEAAWKACSHICSALLFSDLGFFSAGCGETEFNRDAMAFTQNCEMKKKLYFSKEADDTPVTDVIVKGGLTVTKEVD